VLPAVPPIPKAPGTLLPDFDTSSASHLDARDETFHSQHSNAMPDTPEQLSNLPPERFSCSVLVLTHLMFLVCCVMSVVLIVCSEVF